MELVGHYSELSTCHSTPDSFLYGRSAFENIF
jgi:hypothetical protein